MQSQIKLEEKIIIMHYFLIHQTQSDELRYVLPRGYPYLDVFQIVLSGRVGMIRGVSAEDSRCVRIDLDLHLTRAAPVQALALLPRFPICLSLVVLFPPCTLARANPELRCGIQRASA